MSVLTVSSCLFGRAFFTDDAIRSISAKCLLETTWEFGRDPMLGMHRAIIAASSPHVEKLRMGQLNRLCGLLLATHVHTILINSSLEQLILAYVWQTTARHYWRCRQHWLGCHVVVIPILRTDLLVVLRSTRQNQIGPDLLSVCLHRFLWWLSCLYCPTRFFWVKDSMALNFQILVKSYFDTLAHVYVKFNTVLELCL